MGHVVPNIATTRGVTSSLGWRVGVVEAIIEAGVYHKGRESSFGHGTFCTA